MKVIIVALAIVAIAAALPVETEPIKILRSEFNQQPEGGYEFNFETQNGITRVENGELKTVQDEDNKPRSVVVVRGSYTYPKEDGKPETVNYYADETGYHAEGESIPVVPETGYQAEAKPVPFSIQQLGRR